MKFCTMYKLPLNKIDHLLTELKQILKIGDAKTCSHGVNIKRFSLHNCVEETSVPVPKILQHLQESSAVNLNPLCP